MSFTSVCFSNPCVLRIKHNQLCVKLKTEDEEIIVPLHNIASVLLDNTDILITSSVLSKCAELGIALFTVDNRHTPNGVLHGFADNFKHANIAERQINATKPFKNNIWKHIVKQKIYNQGEVLCLHNLKIGENIKMLSGDVKSGDSTYLESYVAKIYFKALFGKEFTRNKDIKMNSMLNYGYAILRGCIARTVASKGLLPSLGVFHSSNVNSFNLADDMIEPFRPILDYYVLQYIENYKDTEQESTLKPIEKKHLLDCLNYSCKINESSTSILTAIEQFVESFVRCIIAKDYKNLSTIYIK